MSFFFYCSRDHLDLHSFPTRRSSDLPHISAHSPTLPRSVTRSRSFQPCPAGPSTRSAGTLTSRSATSQSLRRSEEHTSELQSLTNLVCRLLLEKKKKKKQKESHAQQI